MPRLFHIVRHEFTLATANKAFVILTILGPFLILAVTVLPTLINNNPAALSGGKPIALLSSSPAARAALGGALAGMKVALIDVDSEEAAKKAALEGKVAAFVLIEPGWPDTGRAIFYSKTGVEAALFGAVEAILQAAARESRISASGIDPALLARVLAQPRFEVVKLGAEGAEQRRTQDDFMETLFVSMSFVMLLYMTVLLYGQMIGRSVVAEKTSKTVEVMLSSVTSRELMFGKIFGLGLAGLLQYGVWVTMALLLVRLVGPVLGLAAPPAISPANLAWLVVFFVLAFFLYSAGYAALGSASEDEQHLGQLAWPLIMFLIVPLVMIGSIVVNPESTISLVLSFFPLTSPIVMLIRVLVAPPPAWQLALCISILVVSVTLMVLLAARIFRVGILMTGKRAKLGEVLRWITVR